MLQLPSIRLFQNVTFYDSIKATVKRGKNKIQKGANPERAIRNAYDKTCDCLEILDKRIHIQQRALTCQIKALPHMFQRPLLHRQNRFHQVNVNYL